MTPKQKEALRKKIGQNIRDLCKEMYGPRKERQMAEDLKMSQGSFSDILNGKSLPSCMTIVKLGRLMRDKEKRGGFRKAVYMQLWDVLEV